MLTTRALMPSAFSCSKALTQSEKTEADLVAAQDRVVECARALEAAQRRVPKVTHTDIARAWIKQQAADAQR